MLWRKRDHWSNHPITNSSDQTTNLENKFNKSLYISNGIGDIIKFNENKTADFIKQDSQTFNTTDVKAKQKSVISNYLIISG